MNAKKLLAVAAVLVLVGNIARADSMDSSAVPPPAIPPPDNPPVYHDNRPVFPNNQVCLDVFGTYANRDRFGQDRDRGGAGLGIDYFPIKYFGVGVDSYIQEWKWPYRVNGSLIARLPFQIGQFGLAIYAFGGGGREFKYVPQYTAHGGGGIEFKFTRCLGIFADARRVFNIDHQSPDYNLARAGVSIGF